MDTLFYFVLVEQMIANVALTAVIVVFGRSITRTLHANIEPMVRADVVGNLDHCSLVVANHSACEVLDVCVQLSEANLSDRAESDRRVIFSDTWKSIDAGCSVTCKRPPVVAEALSLDALSGIRNEILLEVSFVRRADGRPFSSSYRLELVEQPDGRIAFAVPAKGRGSIHLRADVGQPLMCLRSEPSPPAWIAFSDGSSTAANRALGDCIG